MTCIGKGTLACRKQVFDRVCPSCRFSGKVDCPSCAGGRAPLEARAPARPPEADANGKAAALDIEARYLNLTRLHEAHLDIFGDDPRPRLEPLRGEASRMLKSLQSQGAGGSGSAEAIQSFLERLGSFRRRWSEIREVFLDEYRSFRTTRGVWTSRERLLGDARGSLRSAAEKQWTDRMDVSLTIAEQRAAALEAVEPSWLPREAKDLEAIWADLGPSSAAELALAARTAEPRETTQAAEAPGRVGSEDAIDEVEPDAAGAGLLARDEDVPEAEPDITPAAAAVPDAPSPHAAAAAARSAVPPATPEEPWAPREGDRASGDAPADEERETPAAPRSWAPLVWSAGGFAAATALFGLLSRRRRSRGQA
jgi:hypothetical protein